MVILDADLLNVDDEELLQMSENVLVTMMGGRITHQKPGFILAGAAETTSSAKQKFPKHGLGKEVE